MDRWAFLTSCGSAVALAACSSSGPIATPSVPDALFERLEVHEFAENAKLLRSFRAGVAAMMAVSDPRSVYSWQYWHNSHWMATGKPPPAMAQVWNRCRHHHVPYFYAWHRAFVYFFERVLRTMSGNPAFALPYWDYYQYPRIPKIFAEATLANGRPNPLYWADRVGTTMRGLSFAPYAPSVDVFPNSSKKSFEWLVEVDPHGSVHDQVGGDMGHVPTAAADPIFYVHHCNIDRLWSAWLLAGGSRAMPAAGDPYMNETFTYNVGGSWSLSVGAMVQDKALGFTFADTALPQAPAGAALPERPRLAAPAAPYRVTTAPFSVPVFGGAGFTGVALEGVELTDLGRRGGYTIRIFAGLPERGAPLRDEGAYAVGEFGSFAVSTAQMRGMGTMTAGGGVDLRFPLPHPAADQPLLLSFVPYADPGRFAVDAELVHIARISLY